MANIIAVVLWIFYITWNLNPTFDEKIEAYLSTHTSINEQIQLYDGLTINNNEKRVWFFSKTCLNIVRQKKFNIL